MHASLELEAEQMVKIIIKNGILSQQLDLASPVLCVAEGCFRSSKAPRRTIVGFLLY